jgi:glutamyl-tRNA synthetase
MVSPTGRFAPSPTGDLHLGNLRTALVAWLSARARGRDFIVRMEDLDRVTSSPQHEASQLGALAELGIDWDGDVIRQSERFAIYDDAIDTLAAAGRTYECFCTRREIRDAISAPQNERDDAGLIADGAYPGTCRALTAQQTAALRAEGRRPATRLRAEGVSVTVFDDLHGTVEGIVDDVVLRRNDGVPAYNLAVVIDDAAQGVVEVVRGDDLLSSTPRQVLLQQLLGLPTPSYMHVPLVLGSDHVRLAKRHGAITLGQLAALGIDASATLGMIAASLGLASGGEPVTAQQLIARFDPAALPREPWVLPENLQRSGPVSDVS